MTIEEAKKIDIVEYLKTMGYRPTKTKGNNSWFLSPIRSESQASFKVNKERNEWYDFGPGIGGDIIELAKHLYHTSYIPDIMRRLAEDAVKIPYEHTIHSTQTVATSFADKAKRNIQLVPLYHYALKNYLKSRHISIEVGEAYCKEVHYEVGERSYFGIAFPNQSGGLEIRNPFFKGCEGHKDISIVHNQEGAIQTVCCVFEGFFDFLSYMELMRRNDYLICLDIPCDYIVLNSVSNASKALTKLESYSKVHCYLDNDNAGGNATLKIANAMPGRVKDERFRYFGYNDLNEYLTTLSGK